MKEELKELWRTCFTEDTEEFIQLYFEEKYTDHDTSVIMHRGKPVSALQRLPYTMTCRGEIIRASYISGACTHPSMRKYGLMTRLLGEAHTCMYKGGVIVSTLIPANEGLIEFYRKSKYTPIFEERNQKFESCTDKASKQCGGISFTTTGHTDGDTEEIFRFVYSRQLAMPSCILHTKADMHTIIADHELSGGEIWKGIGNNGETVSIAFVIAGQDELFIKEIVADSDISLQSTIDFLSARYGNVKAVHHFPLGMMRAINAFRLLELYAAGCSTRCAIEVYGDDTIKENNGIFVISNRKCHKAETEAETANMRYIKLEISELPDFIFGDEKPYMSLMLN